MFPHNILLLFAMQLLIFVLLVNRQVFAIQTVLSHSDSLNIIPLSKKNVKHFLKIFEIFFNFFKIFYFYGIFLIRRARITLYIIYKRAPQKQTRHGILHVNGNFLFIIRIVFPFNPHDFSFYFYPLALKFRRSRR